MVKPSRFVGQLSPYKITPQDVWARTAPGELLKLDWNESPVDFSWYQHELQNILRQSGLIAWYPDCLAIELTDQLSKFVGISSNLILAFPGSDVGLETLCRAYLEPDDLVIVLAPTYENFYVYVSQTGAKVCELPIFPPAIPSETLIANYIRGHHGIKAVYIARPNNPLGYIIPAEEVERLSRSFPDIIFIIDEAYIEFSLESSCATHVERLPNLVVARTFSKAFGMAGMRLGYLCSSLDIINTINKIRNGKNISMISQRLGVFALRNFDKVSLWIDEVRRSRAIFESWCQGQAIHYFPSQGNFVLFKTRRPHEICSVLKSQSIYVRNRHLVVPGYVRATIGSLRHVEALIDALAQAKHLL